jgi:hypothetical protein
MSHVCCASRRPMSRGAACRAPTGLLQAFVGGEPAAGHLHVAGHALHEEEAAAVASGCYGQGARAGEGLL